MGDEPPAPLLHLTLEILYRQFREDFVIMRKSGGRLAVRGSSDGSEDQSPSMQPEINKKILEVTTKMIELLTGEVPIRYQDVAVYLSMEEREYLEEHCDRYKAAMMEAEPPLTSEDKEFTDDLHPSPFLLPDCRGEDDDDIVVSVQASSYWSADDQIMVAYLENFLKIPSKEERGPQWERNPMKAWSKHAERLHETRMGSISLDHSYAFIRKANKSKSQSNKGKTKPKPAPTPNHSKNPTPSPTPSPTISPVPTPTTDTTPIIHSIYSIKMENPDEGFQDSNISTTDDSEYKKVVIKEDTYSCAEEPLQHAAADKCRQLDPLNIKEEPIHSEDTQPYYGSSTFIVPTPYIKQEPSAYEVEVPAEIELYPDGTFYSKKQCKSQQECLLQDHPFSCSICKKRFKQKSGLGRHIKIHTKEEHHSCLDCGKRFLSQSSLWEHQSIHDEEKPYSCSECGKRFSKVTNLNNHQRIHATKNPFSCGECGKQFISNTNLRRHQRKHRVELATNQEFYCLECRKTFTDKLSFQRHQRYHKGSNPYTCVDCGRRFIKKINLIKHQRFHTRKNLHSCQECGKFFMSAAYLVRHMKSHSKKKRSYSCPVCGKYFISSLDFINHQRSHKAETPDSNSAWRNSFIRKLGVVIQERNSVEEKPYSCSDCGELFERKLQLFRHQKSHIKEEILT